MVEHAVEDQPQAAASHLLDQRIEVGLIAEAPVDLEVIDGVVTMRGRRKDRRQQEAGGAEVDRIVEPVADPPEPVLDVGTRGGLALGADKTERIDVPPDRIFDEISQLRFPEVLSERPDHCGAAARNARMSRPF
jgi:hypothetical protein